MRPKLEEQLAAGDDQVGVQRAGIFFLVIHRLAHGRRLDCGRGAELSWCRYVLEMLGDVNRNDPEAARPKAAAGE
jgi:hypothetical protein